MQPVSPGKFMFSTFYYQTTFLPQKTQNFIHWNDCERNVDKKTFGSFWKHVLKCNSVMCWAYVMVLQGKLFFCERFYLHIWGAWRFFNSKMSRSLFGADMSWKKFFESFYLWIFINLPRICWFQPLTSITHASHHSIIWILCFEKFSNLMFFSFDVWNSSKNITRGMKW